MKTVAFIFVRPDSGRLPDKHNRKIGNKTLLEWCIKSTKAFSDQVVILTTKGNEKAYEKHKIDVCAPCEDDDNIILRLKLACKLYPADTYAVVSGDCPLLDIFYVKDMIKYLKDNKGFDYVHGNPKGMRKGVDIMSGKSVDKLPDEGKDMSLSLVGLSGIQLNNMFEIESRLTVDNLADLAFFNEVFNNVDKFTFNSMYTLLNYDPRPTIINSHVSQRKDSTGIYRKKLIITHGDSRFGMGHVARSLALYQMYSEAESCPTRIYVNDDTRAIKYLEDNFLIKELDFYVYDTTPDLLREDIVNCDIIFDKPDHMTLNYKEIYMQDPTFATNYRLNYMKDSGSDNNSQIAYFGMGDNQKYLDKVPSDVDILDESDNFLREINKCGTLYTMFSQTAREALALGKRVKCYTTTEVDSEICRYLETKHKLVWLGNVNAKN